MSAYKLDIILINLYQELFLYYAIEKCSHEDRAHKKIREICYEPPKYDQNSQKIVRNKLGVQIAHT